jgi:hypothetical protein
MVISFSVIRDSWTAVFKADTQMNLNWPHRRRTRGKSTADTLKYDCVIVPLIGRNGNRNGCDIFQGKL